MQDRFWLRFESGERSGDRVAIPQGGLSVGRNPGHGLSIADKSISGSHATLRLENGSVRLIDTGSKNGTRVAGERVAEHVLAHGDSVTFGTVRLVFLDRELDPELGAGQAGSAPGSGEVEVVRRASTASFARGSRRNVAGIAVLAVALLAGGYFAWQRFGSADAAITAQERPVENVPNNLLASATSFEDEQGSERGWTADASAQGALSVGRRWRRTGAVGLGAELAAGEWARSVAEAVAIPLGRGLAARAYFSGDAGAQGRLGLAFLGAKGELVLTQWTAFVTAGAEEPLSLTALPPSEAREVRLLLELTSDTAAGAGFDDVSLLAAAPPEPVAQFAEYRLYGVGESPQAANLYRVESLLLGELGFADASGRPLTLALRAAEHGLAIGAAEPSAATALSMLVAPVALVGDVVTLGEAGYRAYSGAFEQGGVTSVLFAAQHGLVRLALASPSNVQARAAAGGGIALSIQGRSTVSELIVQLAFEQERARTHTAAAEARRAMQQGRAGAAIASWNALLDLHPFDTEVVREAEAARARLVEAGLAELQEIAREVERARFFELAALFRSCQERAVATANAYAGTEVEPGAVALGGVIAVELERLSAGTSRGDAERLAAILHVLLEQGSLQLAGRVSEVLERSTVSPPTAETPSSSNTTGTRGDG